MSEEPEPRLRLQGRTLRGHTARGTIVNGAFTVGVNTLGLVRGFLVAGFLTADDYGIWGIILVAFGTLSWLKAVGIQDRYVQQDDEDQEVAFQRAFTAEAIVNAAFLLVLILAIPVVVLVYGHTEIVLPALAIDLMIPAFVLQSTIWVFYRRMDFVRQRTLQAIDPIVAFVVTVGLAAAGAGYWAFVWGTVAGVWAGALVALAYKVYPLAWRFDRDTLRAYVGFSAPLFVAGLSGTVTAQAAIITANAALGLAAVGFIALATTLSLYTHRIDEIITTTLYPAICAVADRRDLLFETFVKSNRLTLAWGVPFGVGVALFADDLVTFGIGEEWRPAVTLIAAVSLVAATNHFGFNWDAFYRAQGQTKPVAVVAALQTVVFLAAVLPLTISEGLDGYAIGLGIVAAAALGLRTFYLTRLFPEFRMWRHVVRALAPVVPAVAAVLLVREIAGGDRSLPQALAEAVLFLAVTALMTWALERDLVREVTGYLRRPAVVVPTS